MDVSGNREFFFDETEAWLDFLLKHLDRRPPIPIPIDIDIISVLVLELQVVVDVCLKVDGVEVKALLLDEGMVNAVTSLLLR